MLEIPSLLISAAITMGAIPYTDYRHHNEAQAIMRTEVYQYKDKEIYAQHSDRKPYIFSELHKIQKGDRVRIGEEEYSVAKTLIIDPTDVWILRRNVTAIFTCINGTKQRFVAILE